MTYTSTFVHGLFSIITVHYLVTRPYSGIARPPAALARGRAATCCQLDADQNEPTTLTFTLSLTLAVDFLAAKCKFNVRAGVKKIARKYLAKLFTSKGGTAAAKNF